MRILSKRLRRLDVLGLGLLALVLTCCALAVLNVRGALDLEQTTRRGPVEAEAERLALLAERAVAAAGLAALFPGPGEWQLNGLVSQTEESLAQLRGAPGGNAAQLRALEVAWGEERTQLELLSHSDPRAATFAVEGAQLRLRTIAVLDAARAVAEGERADAAAESRELMRWLVLLNAVAVAVVVGLFACLQGQAVRPLRRLARLEQRLRVDPRVRYGPPYPPGVIGRLTRALDHFAGQAERRRELELELRTDELTELYSRRAFFAELERAIERAEVSAADFLVCYVDVNGFKRINDNLGHAIGDQALVDVAQILREAFRAGDVVARLGGDEFAAIAFGVDVTAEPALRDRIEGNVEEFNAFEGRPYQLSLSLGIAGYHASATADALLQLADEAMYREKHGDRDAHEAA